MINKEYYKNIDIASTVLSDKIKEWAKKNDISSLYELIEEFQKRESNASNNMDLSEVFLEMSQLDDEAIQSDNIITLNDEDGREIKFEFLDLIEYNSKEYVVLLPINEDEVLILEIQDDNMDDADEESYISVDDEETLNIIFEIFKEKYKNEFDFV